jgi:hypothetical protein
MWWWVSWFQPSVFLCGSCFILVYKVLYWHILQNEDGTKTEYRVWNPFRSKLAAAILGGVDNIWIVSTCSA